MTRRRGPKARANSPKSGYGWSALGAWDLLRKHEEWKQQELKRTPYAVLDDPPEELRPMKPWRRK